MEMLLNDNIINELLLSENQSKDNFEIKFQ
jgi:hypothetical protein